MTVSRYVALLRGINVGGNNLVPMAALREAFEDAGYGAVRTYIQSGNVVFESDRPAASLESHIETALERRFSLPLMVLVRSRAEMRRVVSAAPPGFGADPSTFHSDVLFLKKPLSAKAVMSVVELRDGVDQAWPGQGVVYFARLSARRAQSRLSRLVSTPEYKSLSIRNWNTTTRLLEMLDA